jgi:hypothetical protein
VLPYPFQYISSYGREEGKEEERDKEERGKEERENKGGKVRSAQLLHHFDLLACLCILSLYLGVAISLSVN